MNPVMMQPKAVKSYVPVVQTIADEFVERIRQIRDDQFIVPADFGNETNKWALESISCIALNQRLELMTNQDPQSDGQQLISVSDKGKYVSTFYGVNFLLNYPPLQAVHDFFMLSFELEMKPSIWKYYKTPEYKKLIACLHKMTKYDQI